MNTTDFAVNLTGPRIHLQGVESTAFRFGALGMEGPVTSDGPAANTAPAAVESGRGTPDHLEGEPPMNAPRLLSVTDARTLANDLVADLGTVPGDNEAVSKMLARWAEELGPLRMGQVCMAAVHLTFADCMSEAQVIVR